MLTNYHTHTTRCGHAEGTEEEYILTALRCGFKVLGFSDHTPWAYATPGFVSRIRMLPSQLDDYVLTLRGLREKYADKLHIRIGLEAEYFPAYLGWLKEEMERLDIEYLILGCHYDTTDEQDARASRFGGSTSTAHGRRYAEQVVEALETGLYRYLAHPDLFLNRVTAFDADAEKACRDICAAAARLDIPLEYNMAGLTLQGRPDGSLGYTRDEFWRIAAEYPVKAIMGCDAHAPSELDVVPSIEEKKAFLAEMGIEASGLDNLITASYDLLGLISFLTDGKKECRAWTIRKGTKAPQAAGKIHSDFERGFIRASVIAYSDLEAHDFDYAAVKAKGLQRTEGKEYVVKDGDVIAIPNDLTNGGRALKVLESAGIITLDPSAGFNPTVDDIQTYHVGVTIKELKANVIVSTLPDVTAAIVNNNYALDFGLAASDAIFADDRLDIEDYWNLIAARTADLSDPAKVEVFRKVVDAYQSDGTLAVYNDQCKGFYSPAGWDQDLLPQA